MQLGTREDKALGEAARPEADASSEGAVAAGPYMYLLDLGEAATTAEELSVCADRGSIGVFRADSLVLVPKSGCQHRPGSSRHVCHRSPYGEQHA